MKSRHFSTEVNRAASEEVTPVPFARSYWIVPGKFLAGAYPGDPFPEEAEEKLRPFIDAGIRCFLDLTSPGDMNLYGLYLVPYQELLEKIADRRFKITYRQMPVTDQDVPSRAQMREILDFIDKAISGNFPVYVNCLGGLGRTGTAVGCWLVRHGIERGEAVFDLIRRLRRNDTRAGMPSPQTDRQRRFIFEWNEGD